MYCGEMRREKRREREKRPDLHVVQTGEIGEQELQKARLVHGQVAASESLQEITEVVARVEGNPLNLVVEDEARHHQELSEVMHVDTKLLELFKVDARRLKEVDAILGEHIPSGGAIDNEKKYT